MIIQTKFANSTRLQYAIIFLALLAACGPVTGPSHQGPDTHATDSTSGGSGANQRPAATSTSTPTPQPSQIKVSPDALDGIEITLWHAWSGAEQPAVQAILNDFNRGNEWGIIAQAKSFGDYDQVLEAVNQTPISGPLPDVVVAYSYQAAEWNQPRGRLIDLGGYIHDPQWGWSKAELADFLPVFQDIASAKAGMINSVPALYSAQVLYYNLTWAQELGYKAPPSTPAEFEKQACSAAQANKNDAVRENDGTGGWMISTGYSAVLGWLHAFGADIAPANSGRYAFNTPAVQTGFRYLRELYEQGCAWLLETPYPQGEFANRQGLFASGSVAGIPLQERAFADLKSTDEWVVIAYPAISGKGVIEMYGPAFQILKSQPARQLAAWLLIQWMTSPENQARLAQASAWLPVRATSFEQMGTLPKTYPQWQSAARLLPQAHSEPPYPSWKIVRWAVSDAATQLFRSYFTLEQLQPMLKLLDETAADLHTNPP